MLISRFIFVICLTAILYFLPVGIAWLAWLKPVCQSPWETLKWLFIPLFLQTMLESLFLQPAIYLPSRLMMMVIGILVMMLLEYGCFKFLHSVNSTLLTVCYSTGLISAFFTESAYAQRNIILHPYDPWFAALGILFLFLIFVLCTYYPADHWFFKNQEG